MKCEMFEIGFVEFSRLTLKINLVPFKLMFSDIISSLRPLGMIKHTLS